MSLCADFSAVTANENESIYINIGAVSKTSAPTTVTAIIAQPYASLDSQTLRPFLNETGIWQALLG